MALVKYRCGLNPSPAPPLLKFSSYLKAPLLPSVPKTFGHHGLFPARSPERPFPIGLLGNDVMGDCVICFGMHASMFWNKLAGRTVVFTTLDAEDDYSDAAGYKPGQPSTDNGLDMVALCQYWQQTGLRDFTGRQRHKIAAFLDLGANVDHAFAASYLFDGGCGLGVVLPPDAEEQFEEFQPWTGAAPAGAPLHCVGLVGRDGAAKVTTWGGVQDADESFVAENLREAVAVVSTEDLINQKSPEGFAWNDLINDLQGFG